MRFWGGWRGSERGVRETAREGACLQKPHLGVLAAAPEEARGFHAEISNLRRGVH
jgi:hypothetical protein